MTRKENLKQHFTEYRGKLEQLLDSVNINDLERVLSTIIDAFRNDHTLFICGNGGSAATASHMQVDFTYFIRHFTQYKPRVLSITDNTPMITAIGNDTSYDNIFADQLRGMMRKGDVLICISASGNSENVIRAAQYANEIGGTSIAFVGFTGGKLKETCKLALYNENPKGEYGTIEDLHAIYMHIMVNYLHKDEEFMGLK